MKQITNKLKFVALAAVMCLGLAAQALSTVGYYCDGGKSFLTPDDQRMSGYATLYAKESETEDNFVKVSYGSGIRFMNGGTSKEGWYSVSVDADKTYDFYFVLDGASANIDWVYTSETVKNSSYDSAQLQFAPHFTYANGTWAVPEPTSGLLMLLGLAGVALKRKRNKA